LDQNESDNVALLGLFGEVGIGTQKRRFQRIKVVADMGVELHLRLILHVAVQFAALHLGVSHLPLLHLIEQVGVRDLRILVPHVRALRHRAP